MTYSIFAKSNVSLARRPKGRYGGSSLKTEILTLEISNLLKRPRTSQSGVVEDLMMYIPGTRLFQISASLYTYYCNPPSCIVVFFCCKHATFFACCESFFPQKVKRCRRLLKLSRDLKVSF